MPVENRRKYLRTHYISPIKYHVVGLEKIHAGGLSVDISKGGLGMITGYPLEVGNILVFEEDFEFKTDNISVNTSIVRWTREIEKDRYRVGLEFIR